MMNKLMLNKGKVNACLILLCLFLIQGCRKDILQPNSKDLQNGISIAEAKAYFNDNLRQSTKREKLMSTSVNHQVSFQDFLANKQPIWDKAYEKMLSTGSSVKIPIDFGDAYAVIDKEKNEVMPLSSLNYLFMYKDSLNAVHAEWIVLIPSVDWLYGNRSEYTGKIIVKDWDGKTIRYLSYNPITTLNTASTIKEKLLSSIGKVQNTTGENELDYIWSFCTRWPTGRCPKTGVCAERCDECSEVCVQLSCTFFDCSPMCDLEEKGGSRGGGGESPGNPSRPGGGGVYPPDDCGGGNQLPKPPANNQNIEGNMIPMPPCIPKPVILMTLSMSNLIAKLGISSESEEAVFLSKNLEVVDALLLYLETNGETPENIEFADWAVGYLTNDPTQYNQGFKNIFDGPDQSFVDNDANSTDLSFDLANRGNPTFEDNGYDIFTSNLSLPDYPANHPVSLAVKNYNPWVYYAFLGANNTSLKHFHLTTKGLDAGDGYRKAIGAIGEGLFVSRITSIPTSPPASVFIGKMFGTTHIDALVVRNVPMINGSGYEIAINYTDINGGYLQKRMHHPDGLEAVGFKETTISYEVKTLNALANTPESLYRMFQEGVKQVKHRASIPYMSAAVLVFDDQAWNKLRNSVYGTQAINDINNLSLVKNTYGEQKIYFRIEKGLSRDANRAFFGIKDKIKDL